MADARMVQLAETIVSYSWGVKPGDRVLIEADGVSTFPMVELLLEKVRKAGGRPHQPLLYGAGTKRRWLLGANEAEIRQEARLQLLRMKQTDCYVSLRGGHPLELSDVPPETMALYLKHVLKGVHLGCRVPKTRWVVLRWPGEAFAQAARMSTAAFEDFFFRACNADYPAMARAMKPLVRLMQRTDQVHITGPGTDLRFSIKDMPVIPCAGKLNIPDGEVYTAPVRNSVEGTIQYNTPTVWQGAFFSGLCFVFRKGRIVEASCESGDAKQLGRILDSDRGARFVGEFALGVNPYITEPMFDTLFDEKIAGSIHFTPGNAYPDCDNGNRSEVHWDIVLVQTAAMGGGVIRFDGKLIRQDGFFIPKELQALNPKN